MLSAKYAADLAGLGRFIRERRHALRLTQSELAGRVGWVQEKISALECGKYGMPALPALAGLAEGLEAPLYDLLAAAGYAHTQRETGTNGTKRLSVRLPPPVPGPGDTPPTSGQA